MKEKWNKDNFFRRLVSWDTRWRWSFLIRFPGCDCRIIYYPKMERFWIRRWPLRRTWIQEHVSRSGFSFGILTSRTKRWKRNYSALCFSFIPWHWSGLKRIACLFEEFFRANTRASIERQFHVADFFVNLLHKVDDKVHEFVLVHLLGAEIRDEKADVVALFCRRRRRKKMKPKQKNQSKWFYQSTNQPIHRGINQSIDQPMERKSNQTWWWHSLRFCTVPQPVSAA